MTLIKLLIISLVFSIVVPAYTSPPVGENVPRSMRDQINLSYSDQLEIICDRTMIQLKKISNDDTVCVFSDSVAKLFERKYLTSIEDDKNFIWIHNHQETKVGETITIFGQIHDSKKNSFALSMINHNKIQFGAVDLVKLDHDGKFVFKKQMIDEEFSSTGIRTFVINYDSELIILPFQIDTR